MLQKKNYENVRANKREGKMMGKLKMTGKLRIDSG